MNRRLRTRWFALALVALSLSAQADEEASADGLESETPEAAAEDAAGLSPDNPKTMSGMSILGNEEAPKALVIVPWKSSELGDDPSLTDSLDERARPVDREVFARELRYYAIRSGRESTE